MREGCAPTPDQPDEQKRPNKGRGRSSAEGESSRISKAYHRRTTKPATKQAKKRGKRAPGSPPKRRP